MCREAEWGDWVESCQVEYDPAVVSYEELLRCFFKSHEPSWSPARQYASVIFTADDAQSRAAQAEYARQEEAREGRLGTSLEALGDFYDAEAYHQKWLLQRKGPLFKALGLDNEQQLKDSPLASKLNAFAGGHLAPAQIADELAIWLQQGHLTSVAAQRLSQAAPILGHYLTKAQPSAQPSAQPHPDSQPGARNQITSNSLSSLSTEAIDAPRKL